MLPQLLTNFHPFLDPEPANPTCAVKATVYISTQYFDAIALSKPTASPVPTIVSGAIVFETENLLPEPIQVCGPAAIACLHHAPDTLHLPGLLWCKDKECSASLRVIGALSGSAASELCV